MNAVTKAVAAAYAAVLRRRTGRSWVVVDEAHASTCEEEDSEIRASPAAVLSVLVKADGIAATNSQLQALRRDLDQTDPPSDSER